MFASIRQSIGAARDSMHEGRTRVAELVTELNRCRLNIDKAKENFPAL